MDRQERAWAVVFTPKSGSPYLLSHTVRRTRSAAIREFERDYGPRYKSARRAGKVNAVRVVIRWKEPAPLDARKEG